MKTNKVTSSLFLGLMLSLGVTACNDEDINSSSADYSDLIPGSSWYVDVTDSEQETLDFDYKGSGTVCFYDLVDNDWGIMAFGAYELNDNIITATYDDVSVVDEDYKSTSWHGFTDGKSKTVKYTIISCDGEKLVLKNGNGDTRTYIQ